MNPESAGETAFRAGENVSRETFERLRVYAQLLVNWNPSAGLVGEATLNQLWVRHFLDSAQLLRFRPKRPSCWLDLGTGGGFPGMVLAIIAAERAPECRFTLVESNQRKCQFLGSVVRKTGVEVKIKPFRAEELEPEEADVVTARALAPMKRLLALAYRHLGNDGFGLFPKGRNVQEEIAEARKEWRFNLQMHPSVSDTSGSVLVVKGLQRG